MSDFYKHYINTCGNCEKKASFFNELEQEKLKIDKQQFEIILSVRKKG